MKTYTSEVTLTTAISFTKYQGDLHSHPSNITYFIQSQLLPWLHVSAIIQKTTFIQSLSQEPCPEKKSKKGWFPEPSSISEELGVVVVEFSADESMDGFPVFPCKIPVGCKGKRGNVS